MNLPVPLLIAAHYLTARRRWQTLRGAALQRYQAEHARKIVRFAFEHSSFYRAHWDGCDLAAWRALPTVDKRLMMSNFDRFTTRGVRSETAMQLALRAERERDFRPTLNGLTVGLSSGTSGHRGLFVLSAYEQAAWAGTILARTLPGIRRRGYRVAFFLRSNSNLYEQTNGRLVNFRYFDLMLPLADAVAGLNAYRADIIVGPPSLLELLAASRARGELRHAPELLVSVAEVLEPQAAQAIERIFEAPVHQVYQCTEGLLALSCTRGSLHIQEDLVALQLEPLPGVGERLTPIVTDLHRTTQPIIRYRLGDVLQLDPNPCACGSEYRVIRCIEGRADDVLFFEACAGGLRPFYPDTLRRAILLAGSGIADYQVFQTPDRRLRVHLVIEPSACFEPAACAVRAGIVATLAQYDCRMVELSIEEGLAPVAAGAKRRRVQRLA